MAFKEIQYWASIINDEIDNNKKYVDVCNKSIKTAKLNESKKIQDIDEDVLDPLESGFGECPECNEDDVFNETPDPLKEKINPDTYLEREEELDECCDDDCYATICVKFNDENEDGLTDSLKNIFQNFIDIDCQNTTDNQTNYPIYKLIGPLAQLKQMFASSHKDCNSFNDLPDCCKQKFNKCLNSNDALDESDFFTFKGFDGDVNPSTANLVKPDEVEMSIVAEQNDQKKTIDESKIIDKIYNSENNKLLKIVYSQKNTNAIKKYCLSIKDKIKSLLNKTNNDVQNRIKTAVNTIKNASDDSVTRNSAFMTLLWLDILSKVDDSHIQLSDKVLNNIQNKMSKYVDYLKKTNDKIVNESLKKNSTISN